jgi:hypothetical protein
MGFSALVLVCLLVAALGLIGGSAFPSLLDEPFALLEIHKSE